MGFKNTIAFCGLVIFGLLCGNLSAQVIQRIDTIKVFQNSVQLKNAWAGGFNFCQFSEIDLNGDSVNDLFVFDRTGNKVRTFINSGISNTVDYQYAPQYETKFPELHDWALLFDYNCDGKNDIFTYSYEGGVTVYKNTSSAAGLSFHLAVSLLSSAYNPPPNPRLNLYVSSADIPAIIDVDNDGDLDILTFSLGGTTVEYHKNLSMETLGNCDTLNYTLIESCWGMFEENFANNSVTMGITCKGGIGMADTISQVMHSGSTLCMFDADCDGDKELLLGDVSSEHMNLLTNGGDINNANITAQDATFPSNDVSVDLTVFPAAFYLDVNNDGQKDLLMSGSAPNASENAKCTRFYEDTNRTCQTNFIYRQQDFLQNEMIEMGEGAYPQFFDYDSDGDQDLIIGNNGYWRPTGTYKSALALYKNIGTNASPAYEMADLDFASLSALGLTNLYPTFGDLDNDGDKDMIVGDYAGNLHYYINNPVGGEASFSLSLPSIPGSDNIIIDVGNFATPFLYDLNNDGLLDLVIGEMSGNLNYYQNVGSATAFSFQQVTNYLGQVDVRINANFFTGYSAPFLIKDNGETKLLVGSERGFIHYYNGIDGNLSGAFNRVDTMIGKIYDGVRNSVSCYNYDGNGNYYWANGNYSGGLAFYSGKILLTTSPEAGMMQSNLSVSPNPATESITIGISDPSQKITSIEIFDSFGRRILQRQTNSNKFTLSIQDLRNGLYFIKALDDQAIIYSSKFVKF